jgi:hypothetical protein
MKRNNCSMTPAVAVSTIIAFLSLVPAPVSAYVGPGTGISLIGAIIAVIAAILFTVGGIFLWPFRALKRWLRKRRGEEPVIEEEDSGEKTEGRDG